jgi:hypothetical protein
MKVAPCTNQKALIDPIELTMKLSFLTLSFFFFFFFFFFILFFWLLILMFLFFVLFFFQPVCRGLTSGIAAYPTPESALAAIGIITNPTAAPTAAAGVGGTAAALIGGLGESAATSTTSSASATTATTTPSTTITPTASSAAAVPALCANQAMRVTPTTDIESLWLTSRDVCHSGATGGVAGQVKTKGNGNAGLTVSKKSSRCSCCSAFGCYLCFQSIVNSPLCHPLESLQTNLTSFACPPPPLSTPQSLIRCSEHGWQCMQLLVTTLVTFDFEAETCWMRSATTRKTTLTTIATTTRRRRKVEKEKERERRARHGMCYFMRRHRR